MLYDICLYVCMPKRRITLHFIKEAKLLDYINTVMTHSVKEFQQQREKSTLQGARYVCHCTFGKEGSILLIFMPKKEGETEKCQIGYKKLPSILPWNVLFGKTNLYSSCNETKNKPWIFGERQSEYKLTV
jgi:hypothetical protein